ncbi:Rgg/GadR/MutR family transcriptional regulator [Lactobacillus sp. ESL0677]|uniref:helix-turn-helix domain-containing protein n=1 Tax=Lactobacillus sp. ESL0677 TaxID=2983208 RepID=UPI0023F928B2|nr:Rgg/GadR/MutR family transcriptional regulator [Lactobacillus sp. ESL0677]WEV36891.1 Rgg/GadR/MutR family transcriptional regulator [Lactobacillus sp. ESL0677]
MTIGELLKKYRLESLKTQKEWVGDIVSPSYYSKVEKNVHRITAEDLLLLLNHNNISPDKFFKQLNQNQETDKERENQLFNFAAEANYKNSVEDLRKIRRMFKESNFADKEDDLVYIDAEIAEMTDEKLPAEEQQALKQLIFKVADFDETSLTLYCNYMGLFDIDSNLIISKRVVKQFIHSPKVKLQAITLGLITNLVIQCIEEQREDEADFFIENAGQVTVLPETFFSKNILQFMVNIIMYHRTGDEKLLEQCKAVIANLAFTGMTEYSEELQKFYVKYK